MHGSGWLYQLRILHGHVAFQRAHIVMLILSSLHRLLATLAFKRFKQLSVSVSALGFPVGFRLDFTTGVGCSSSWAFCSWWLRPRPAGSWQFAFALLGTASLKGTRVVNVL